MTEFRINNQSIPFSPVDSVRWQEVTFENWSTLTFRVHKPTSLDLSKGGGDPLRDVNRTFEVSGVAGGQRVFHYYADEVNKTLYLEGKYKAIPDQRNLTAGAGGDGGTDRNLNLSNDSRSNQHPEQLQRKKVKDAQESWMPVAALKNIGDEVNKINPLADSARRRREYADAPKNEKRNRMILRYETAEGNHIALTGIDEHKDSIRWYWIRWYGITP